VTIGFAVEGRTPWSDVPEYLAGEFVGAFIGATLVWLAYLDHWRETEDPGLKLACFSTAPAIRNPVSNLITEIIGTFVLVFGVMAFFANEAVASDALSGLLVALLVLGIGLSLGGPTGYAINPARDLGPRIMHAILPIAGKGGSDWSYAWIPVVGPLIGAVIAAAAFSAFFPG
jgi:glycerol uptake facilitator protein